ncbi:MAG: beta/gamma crystallin-related protein [Casimicrobiaceae bacterium]
MKTKCTFVPAALLLLATSTLSAQEITIFQNPNFTGPNFSATSSVANLANVGFNDRAASATIRNGTWQLCSDDFFRGQCVTLPPGNYNNLGAMGLNNAVSSLREVGWSGGSGGIGAGGGGGGGPAITLFDNQGMTGRSVTLTAPVANFEDLRFNDRASSAIVTRGTWQICTDANFSSNCETFRPGSYANIGGVTGRASSARPLDGGGGGGGGGPGWGSGGGGRQGGPRIVIYEGPNFSGRSYVVSNDLLANFSNAGFNDRASSLRIEQGYWLFCTDANFGGQCRTLGPGDYATLPYGLSTSISSARKISNDYPYNRPPNW